MIMSKLHRVYGARHWFKCLQDIKGVRISVDAEIWTTNDLSTNLPPRESMKKQILGGARARATSPLLPHRFVKGWPRPGHRGTAVRIGQHHCRCVPQSSASAWRAWVANFEHRKGTQTARRARGSSKVDPDSAGTRPRPKCNQAS